MANAQHMHRATLVPHTTTTTTTQGSWLLFASNAVLSALSITNVALISSMVAWFLEQKQNVHSYQIDWPGNTVQLNFLPKNLWVSQGYEALGVAGYGSVLGIFGMITAWRLRRAARPLKSLTTLAVLQFLAILVTLSALIFVFVVSHQTPGQHIREPIASNNIGADYPEFQWTLETWMNAVLNLPLADQGRRDQINSKITYMVAWRCMLVPLFVVDCIAFVVTVLARSRQRKGTTSRSSSMASLEKPSRLYEA